MDLEAADLTAFALVTMAAVASGLFFVALRQPAIVGYILAGVVLGPTGLGLVKNSANVTVLAELGVLMLLFLIGMHLSLRAFVAVMRVALLCTLLQVVLALGVASAFGAVLGWSPNQALLIGFLLSLSSTAVAMKMLQDIGALRTDVGRVTIGVLMAQDLAVVPMLIVVGSMGSAAELNLSVVVKVSVATAVLVAGIWFLSQRDRLALPFGKQIARRPDMIPVASLAFCFLAATASGLLGLSPAYGAFVAGLLIAHSTGRPAVIRAIQPIQSVLMVVFFLAIGLLIDLDFIWAQLGTVLTLLLAVILIKTVINVAALRVLGEPLRRAFPAAVVMAQIGEFSFVLAALGLAVGAIDGEGYRLAIAVIALSLLISPLWLESARRWGDLAEGVGAVDATGQKIYWTILALLRRRPKGGRRQPAPMAPAIPSAGERDAPAR